MLEYKQLSRRELLSVGVVTVLACFALAGEMIVVTWMEEGVRLACVYQECFHSWKSIVSHFTKAAMAQFNLQYFPLVLIRSVYLASAP